MALIGKIVFVAVLMICISTFGTCEEKKILTRKRRYLTFPKESSLQMIYDQIVGIVDYTNYLILGVTCAMTWPLPTEPIDTDFLREKFQNESSPLRRTDENVSDIPVIEQVDQYYKTNGDDFRDNEINSNWNEINSYQNGMNKITYGAPWDDSTRQKFSSNKVDYASLTISKPIKRHQLYVAIGKRSTPTTSKLDRFYLNHHRSTRHNLYKTIEKYLNAHGKNGTECVLKALCETRKKQTDETPTSFVGEIMRVIFSLPPSNHDSMHTSLSRQYDEAHNSKNDCSSMYPNCKDSLWSADFIK